MKITSKYLKSFSNFNFKKSFSDTVVKVDYSDVMSAKSKKIEEIIDKAFGRNSLGLVILKNVPEIKKIKDVVLDSGLSLINMPESDKADFTEEKIKDYLGWKERDVTWNDKVDKFVGEFSARTNNETVFYPADPKVEEKFLNVWPKNIPNFQKKFIELGKKVGKIQSSMLNHIDNYLTNFIKIDNKNRLKNIVNHHDLFAMLLCYKPPKKLISEWINMHRDNGFITGLVHPNYYNIETKERIDQSSSLQIKDRNGNFHFMNYSHDEIVLQKVELCTL